MAKPRPGVVPLVTTVDGLCVTLCIERTKAFDMIRDGEFETLKVGSRRRILVKSIDAYIERQRQKEAS